MPAAQKASQAKSETVTLQFIRSNLHPSWASSDRRRQPDSEKKTAGLRIPRKVKTIHQIARATPRADFGRPTPQSHNSPQHYIPTTLMANRVACDCERTLPVNIKIVMATHIFARNRQKMFFDATSSTAALGPGAAINVN
jgi:hypothetical protein